MAVADHNLRLRFCCVPNPTQQGEEIDVNVQRIRIENTALVRSESVRGANQVIPMKTLVIHCFDIVDGRLAAFHDVRVANP
jgi:hypothetical protein